MEKMNEYDGVCGKYKEIRRNKEYLENMKDFRKKYVGSMKEYVEGMKK